MQGGGACETEEACVKRAAGGGLGSSKTWPSSKTQQSPFTRNCTRNPVFCSWNQVFLPYCSGDVWKGTMTQPRSVDSNGTTGTYVAAGHLNVAAAVAELKATKGFGKAEHVLVSGASAGGAGSFGNLDYIAQALPGVETRGAPLCGWFYPDVLGRHQLELHPAPQHYLV